MTPKFRIPVTRPYVPSAARYEVYLNQALDRRWLTNNGPLLQELTARLQARLKVDNLLLVANGTLALQIAFRAVGIRTAAVVSPFTFAATVSAMHWEGVRPVFADIDARSLDLDPAKAEGAIAPDVTGVVPVHVYGNPCAVDDLEILAARHNLKIVYDAAHAFAIELDGESLLKHGDAATLSFHATKLFHTAEGGAVVFRSRDDYERAARMINFGIDVNDGSIVDPGINAKLSELHAAMGLAVLDDLPLILERRLELLDLYDRELADTVETQAWAPHASRNGAYVPILLGDEAQCLCLNGRLEREGVEARRYFHPPLARVPLYEHGAATPIADAVSRRILCLPIYHDLDPADVRAICQTVRAVVAANTNTETV